MALDDGNIPFECRFREHCYLSLIRAQKAVI
jgi:hypothetical protein